MKTPIVFTHGFAASRLQWKYQVEAFEKLGYPVFSVDLLGHGEGLKPRLASDYTIDRVYSEYARCYQGFDLTTPVTLVGHSLGAYVSLRYALQHPERVARLILISPLFSPAQLAFSTALFLKNPVASAAMLRAAPTWTIQWAIHGNRIDSGGLARPVVRQVAQDYKRADARIVYIGRTLRDLSSCLGDLPIRPLMIWGDRDRTLAPHFFRGLFEKCPGLRQVCICGGGHALPLTHHQIVNDAIVNFLNDDFPN